MFASLAVLLLTLAYSLLAPATFTVPGCWQQNCLVQNDAGTLCLRPSYNGVPNGNCNDVVLMQLLDIHVHSSAGFSVAYYDERGSILGHTIWPVPTPLPFPVFVCMSGRRNDLDNGFRTLCRTALHDNDIRNPSAHARECAMEVPQLIVSDGCYTAPPKPANPLDRPALIHALFVLGGMVTIATLLSWLRKPLKDGWRYFATSQYGRRILGYPAALGTRRENIVRPFDLSLYPRDERYGNLRVRDRDAHGINPPTTAFSRENNVVTRRAFPSGLDVRITDENLSREPRTG
ncbi:hypothetical protein EXIGLDRAFT_829856 [Exidia glandulosa HHB12029]|uniref:Autophagy-related protein 27 n=1 Tax=Exidia glandulosa HHB12029 TaxID=1314781 RepID=A0A165P4J5_EXIGL|nr:hypothetical protein EXIGLDRAFT_829856 [Exidia glandulosa HHB12029]